MEVCLSFVTLTLSARILWGGGYKPWLLITFRRHGLFGFFAPESLHNFILPAIPKKDKPPLSLLAVFYHLESQGEISISCLSLPKRIYYV